MGSSRRHDSLIPLSHEHHYGLMLCLRIHRGLSQHGGDERWLRAKAAQAAKFFRSDLTPHFRAEEEALFPAMRDFAGARELLEELISDHRELERLAARLGGTGPRGLRARSASSRTCSKRTYAKRSASFSRSTKSRRARSLRRKSGARSPASSATRCSRKNLSCSSRRICARRGRPLPRGLLIH
jgi:hypothetical protein